MLAQAQCCQFGPDPAQFGDSEGKERWVIAVLGIGLVKIRQMTQGLSLGLDIIRIEGGARARRELGQPRAGLRRNLAIGGDGASARRLKGPRQHRKKSSGALVHGRSDNRSGVEGFECDHHGRGDGIEPRPGGALGRYFTIGEPAQARRRFRLGDPASLFEEESQWPGPGE